MDEMTIYWITRLDTFKEVFSFISVMSCITSVAMGVITLVGTYDNDMMYNDGLLKRLKQIACISFVCFTVFGLIYCFLPSTKEMFAIKCIPAIASKENVEKFKDISNDMLDATANYIKDLNKPR